MLAAALTVRFILELALLAGVALLSFYLVQGWLRLPVTILAPIAVAVVWGLLLSPKAPVQLPEAAKLVIEAVLFIGTGAGLFVIGLGFPAILLVLVWVVDRVAITLLKA